MFFDPLIDAVHSALEALDEKRRGGSFGRAFLANYIGWALFGLALLAFVLLNGWLIAR